jgi:hypothetical protein
MGGAIILAVQAYGALGALVAAWFLLWRIEQVDPMARGAYAFRPLLVPGILLLWPLVFWRATHAPALPQREFRTAHRRIWIGLAILLPLLVLGSLALRQNGPTEARPERLAAP